jgi:hypothetical protein
MDPLVRVVRILQIAVIVSVLLFILILNMIHPAPQSVSASLQWSIVVLAILSAESGFRVQRLMLRTRSQSLLRSSTPRSRWLGGHAIRLATAESVALFGFVLRMIGSSSNLVIALFAGSLLLLIFWQPGAVPAENESQRLIS